MLYFNETYTPKLMVVITKFFYLLPASIYGFFIIEILNGRYESFLIFLPWILVMYVVCYIGIYLLWRYGLRSYEAFG